MVKHLIFEYQISPKMKQKELSLPREREKKRIFEIYSERKKYDFSLFPLGSESLCCVLLGKVSSSLGSSLMANKFLSVSSSVSSVSSVSPPISSLEEQETGHMEEVLELSESSFLPFSLFCVLSHRSGFSFFYFFFVAIYFLLFSLFSRILPFSFSFSLSGKSVCRSVREFNFRSAFRASLQSEPSQEPSCFDSTFCLISPSGPLFSPLFLFSSFPHFICSGIISRDIKIELWVCSEERRSSIKSIDHITDLFLFSDCEFVGR